MSERTAAPCCIHDPAREAVLGNCACACHSRSTDDYVNRSEVLDTLKALVDKWRSTPGREDFADNWADELELISLLISSYRRYSHDTLTAENARLREALALACDYMTHPSPEDCVIPASHFARNCRAALAGKAGAR